MCRTLSRNICARAHQFLWCARRDLSRILARHQRARPRRRGREERGVPPSSGDKRGEMPATAGRVAMPAGNRCARPHLPARASSPPPLPRARARSRASRPPSTLSRSSRSRPPPPRLVTRSRRVVTSNALKVSDRWSSIVGCVHASPPPRRRARRRDRPAKPDLVPRVRRERRASGAREPASRVFTTLSPPPRLLPTPSLRSHPSPLPSPAGAILTSPARARTLRRRRRCGRILGCTGIRGKSASTPTGGRCSRPR